jgi:hypothetical protein
MASPTQPRIRALLAHVCPLAGAARSGAEPASFIISFLSRTSGLVVPAPRDHWFYSLCSGALAQRSSSVSMCCLLYRAAYDVADSALETLALHMLAHLLLFRHSPYRIQLFTPRFTPSREVELAALITAFPDKGHIGELTSHSDAGTIIIGVELSSELQNNRARVVRTRCTHTRAHTHTHTHTPDVSFQPQLFAC